MTANLLLNSQEVRKLPAGTLFKAIFVVSAISQRSDKNGKPYYDITVTDSLGNIEAKVWSDAQWLDKSESLPQSEDDRLPAEKIGQLAGKSVGVNGKVAEYRGLLQFNFNKITLLNQEKYPPAGYLPHSPIALEELISRFERLVSGCGGEAGKFLRFVFKDELWQRFRDWPAAVSHHHAYANGLLEHTLSVAECAKAMAASMTEAGYEIDMDIVVAGALLHDLGKLEAYRMTPVPEITVEGALLDHVAQGYLRFNELAAQFGLSEKPRTHLAHILLSHHGQREFGSPVIPATPEALIVSAADELDFKIFCWNDAVKNLTDEQPISAWNNSTQRRFWKK
ncbi:MAG: HD domain-containing protein [Synergistaceae bacterium]|nr:HD domain-containing protein [Synergistaceae bacterium]